MLRNALYLDLLYKTDCENKINYRLVEADNDIVLENNNTDPLISIVGGGTNLLGDQILGSNLPAITIKNGNGSLLKTILIADSGAKKYFKFIDITDMNNDQLSVENDNLDTESSEN